MWSAILASILTHIAVFVPLFFLTGISSIMFRQLSAVVIFSLLTSLLVAVTLVPVLCSKILQLPPPAASGRVSRSTGPRRPRPTLKPGQWLSARPAQGPVHRPTVLALGAASVVVALLILPPVPTELTAQTDEGQVNVSAELPIGTRIEITDDGVTAWLEGMVRRIVPEAIAVIASAAVEAVG